VSAAALAEATRDYAARFTAKGASPDAYRILGKTGLTVSALGFGAYRVDDETPEHRQALEKALLEGCNLIDTSTNYTDGASERCIGGVLEEMTRSGRMARGEIVVVSKIGYVQGRNMDLALRREEGGGPFPEMVKVSEGCWHCVHPEFLEDQLDRSLSRLRLERLDACLLHNPEYFLGHGGGGRSPSDREAAWEEFYRRIRVAFVHLEREVRRGRIGWYGVSSNSFGAPPEDPESTSVGRMLEAAREAAREAGSESGEDHFAVAQLPMNLFEHGPATLGKEGAAGDRSAVAFAAGNGLGVLVNRPLNAFAQGELIRLADFRTDPPRRPVEEGLSRVSALEEEFVREIGRGLKAERGSAPVETFFAWGSRLSGAVGKLGGVEHWQAIEDQQIRPQLLQIISALQSGLPPGLASTFQEWLRRYLPEMQSLCAAFHADCAARSQERSDRIASTLDPALPPDMRSESLSRKALHAVASVPGVTCVLNGMRHPHYAEDSLGILRWDRLPRAMDLLGRL